MGLHCLISPEVSSELFTFSYLLIMLSYPLVIMQIFLQYLPLFKFRKRNWYIDCFSSERGHAAKSLQLCPTLCDPHRRQPTSLPRPWDSPGKNTGVGCHCPLRERGHSFRKTHSSILLLHWRHQTINTWNSYGTRKGHYRKRRTLQITES